MYMYYIAYMCCYIEPRLNAVWAIHRGGAFWVTCMKCIYVHKYTHLSIYMFYSMCIYYILYIIYVCTYCIYYIAYTCIVLDLLNTINMLNIQ